MIKRFIQAFFWIYALIFIPAVVQSCCDDAVATTVEWMLIYSVGEYEERIIADEQIDTVSNRFILNVMLNMEYSSREKYSLLNSAYATKKCSPTNLVVEETISISLDRDITYKGTSISAGTNLIGVDEGAVKVLSISSFGVEIYFSENFIADVIMPDALYEFSFHARTDDDRDLDGSDFFEVKL